MCYKVYLTSRAETNCNGRSALFISGIFVSRSYSALLMLVSISEGFCREGLLAAILFSAGEDIMSGFGRMCCYFYLPKKSYSVNKFRVCLARMPRVCSLTSANDP